MEPVVAAVVERYVSDKELPEKQLEDQRKQEEGGFSMIKCRLREEKRIGQSSSQLIGRCVPTMGPAANELEENLQGT